MAIRLENRAVKGNILEGEFPSFLRGSYKGTLTESLKASMRKFCGNWRMQFYLAALQRYNLKEEEEEEEDV
jgi:hypothetical protein